MPNIFLALEGDRRVVYLLPQSQIWLPWFDHKHSASQAIFSVS